MNIVRILEAEEWHTEWNAYPCRHIIALTDDGIEPFVIAEQINRDEDNEETAYNHKKHFRSIIKAVEHYVDVTE